MKKSIILILFFWTLCLSTKSQCLNSEITSEKLVSYTVFISGSEGYHTFRIPSIAQAKDGTIIAIAEGRRDNSGDPGNGHIDLVYKLSHDGGLTWSDLKMLSKSKEGWGASNPTMVVCKNSRILVLYDSWKPGKGGNRSHYSQAGTLDNQLWCTYSDDNGDTWSVSKDITEQGRDIKNWSNAVFGPGHGIETEKGRIIIPLNAPGKFPDDLYRTASLALYSDDGGQNWIRGEQIDANTSENQIVELDNGSLMMNARQKENVETRIVSISTDQGQTWNKSKPGQICVQICAGLLKYQYEKRNILLWSGIKGPGRSNLILQMSRDQGQSFTGQLLVDSGPAAYSDLTLVGNKGIGILWETGKKNPYEKIVFTLIPDKVIKKLYHKTRITRLSAN